MTFQNEFPIGNVGDLAAFVAFVMARPRDHRPSVSRGMIAS